MPTVSSLTQKPRNIRRGARGRVDLQVPSIANDFFQWQHDLSRLIRGNYNPMVIDHHNCVHRGLQHGLPERAIIRDEAHTCWNDGNSLSQ